MKIDHLTPQDWAHHDPTVPQRLVRHLLGRPGREIARRVAWPGEKRDDQPDSRAAADQQ